MLRTRIRTCSTTSLTSSVAFRITRAPFSPLCQSTVNGTAVGIAILEFTSIIEAIDTS
eukprot:Awhi_evm1s247